MDQARDESVGSLRDHPLLQRLADEQLERFASAGEVESYAPGEEIVTEGSLGDSIYLVLSGNATVQKGGVGGRKLAALGAGEFFGEMSLVEAASRSASVIAVEPTEVFRLPNQALHRLAAEDPRAMNIVLIAIVRTLSQRLRQMNETIAAVGQLSDWISGSLV
jgi:CRP/FNR family transcriptional regulator, cyclic AMP receptor protein